jgi:hypothetical protein
VIVGIFVVVALAVGLWALAYMRLTPHPLAISAVLGDLRRYDGQTVTVQGTVRAAFNVAGVKWYELNDGTGSVMVVTDRGLPREGDYERVTGQVKQLFQLGDATYTVIEEPQPPS